MARPDPRSWRSIVASALTWEQAHVGLETALADLPPELRGRHPAGAPHSIWELVEHIRRAQRDLLDFCTDPGYAHELEWPGDYWPDDSQPPSPKAWDESLDQIRRDRAQLEEWAVETDTDLTDEIPWGEGQTYLRSILVAADHTSYHVGQIVLVRRLLEAWR